jgi:hypothetical protein
LQASLLSTILLVADADVGELDDFIAALPTPPPGQFVASSLVALRDHYAAVTLGTIDKPYVSLTSRGVLLAALGVDVPLAHLVLVGASIGLLVPAAQAAAILSAVGSLVRDDEMVHLIDFDNGTSCDVLALLQVYRAWVHQQVATHALASDPVLWGRVKEMVRPHVALDIRDKTFELVSQLDQFGLASQYYAGQQTLRTNFGRFLSSAFSSSDATSASQNSSPEERPQMDELRVLRASSSCWEEACDISPLSGSDSLTFVAMLAMGFVRNTLTTQQTPAQSRAIKKYGPKTTRDAPFVPYHEVTVRHVLLPTALDVEQLQEWLMPCVTSVQRGDSDLKSIVRFRVDRIVRYLGESSGRQQTAHLADDEFACRIVRGTICYDAYRLLKMGRDDSRRLNIAFCDCPAETHLVSSWFVEAKSPFFLDRVSMLYPLVADVRYTLCPALIACQVQKRKRHIAVQQVSLLPGGLSYFPLVAALLMHWDGKTIDGNSAVIKSLPHCHPDVKKLERFCVDLGDVVTLNSRLRDFYTGQFDQVMSQRNFGAAVARGGDSQIGNLFSSSVQRQSWLASREKVVQMNREMLDLLLCRYIRDLPPYFAPAAVDEMKLRYRSRMPLTLLAELGPTHTEASLRSVLPPALIRLAGDDELRDDLGRELESLLSLGDPTGLQTSGRGKRLLPAATRANEIITSEMLRKYRMEGSTLARQGVLDGTNGSRSLGAVYGVPLRSDATQTVVPIEGGGDAPLPALKFLRRYAQRYMADQTVRSSLSIFVWPALQQAASPLTNSMGGFVEGGRIICAEPVSETSGGLLAFWAANSPEVSAGTWIAMTQSSVAFNVLGSSMSEVGRFARNTKSALALPTVDVWARQDCEPQLRYVANFVRDVMETVNMIVSYLPPVAPVHLSRVQPSHAAPPEAQSVALSNTAFPPLEAEERDLLQFLRAVRCCKRTQPASAVYVVLFVHSSRVAVLQQHLRQGWDDLLGQTMVETSVQDELVGGVMLFVSKLITTAT